MNMIKNIAYGTEPYHVGDLFLPENPNHAQIILLVHGGGWTNMTRQRVDGIATFLAKLGYAVFNIDYRLLSVAAYPACEEDTIAAGRFLLESDANELSGLRRDSIIMAGGSAGAHLALMAGLKLPRRQVAGIIDISGPTDLTAPEIKPLLDQTNFYRGHEDRNSLLAAASPTLLVQDNPPPLLILHSANDPLVASRQADRLFQIYREHNGLVNVLIYDGNPDKYHDIWSGDKEPLHLWPFLEKQIELYLTEFCPRS